MTVVAAALVPATGGLGGVALSAGLNLMDDALFTGLDIAGGYKSWNEAGLEFGKKALAGTAAATVSLGFNGFGTDGSFAGLAGTISAESGSFARVAADSAFRTAQTLTSGLASSAINAVNYGANGWTWSQDAFSAGLRSSLSSSLSAGTSAFTSGLLDNTLSGFYGKLFNDGATLNNLVGGAIGQSAGYALGQDYTFNLLNASLFNITGKNGAAVESGLLELHAGKNGITMNIGTEGLDLSYGSLAAALRGAEAWKVNAALLLSGESEAARYASALRTLYSGDAVNRAEYEAILAGRTNIVEDRNLRLTESVYDSYSGTKTIRLGSSALEDGSRFGLNVIVAHEAYRDGIIGSDDVQQFETYTAVTGHIGAALGLMQTYGSGAIGETMASEAKDFYNAVLALYAGENNTGALTQLNAVLGAYDSSADYWLLKKDGTIIDDGSADLHWEAVNKSTADDPIYKTIMSFPGLTKEESLVAILGGTDAAAAVLAANGIQAAKDASAADMGALLAGLKNDNGTLKIEYAQIKGLERNWLGIYQSYTANENFYKQYTIRGVYRGNPELLKRENKGEAVTSDIEYYAIMYQPLLEEIRALGNTTISDPLAYLVANTALFSFSGWGSVTVHNDLHEGLQKAFAETKAGGAAIPATSGGLLLRFQDTPYNGKLVLSRHAVGMAVDFAAATNRM
jgi:hypothetical protein